MIRVPAHQTPAAIIKVLNDRAMIAVSDNTAVVNITGTDISNFSNNQYLDTINLDSFGTGTATISLFNTRGGRADVNVKVGNLLPVAKAGGDQTVSLKNSKTVTLNGQGSFDPDGDNMSYSWYLDQSLVPGLTTVLSKIHSDITSFNAIGTGTYRVSLTVKDDLGEDTDTATITVKP